jgi:hypothetical protein
MWRRMALVIASTALISLVAASWIRVHGAVSDSNRIISDRINDTAQSFSRELRGRVDLADALARYLTATDGGAGGVLLRERMLSADAFHGVELSAFKVSAHDDADQLSDDDRLKLMAGQSLLRPIPTCCTWQAPPVRRSWRSSNSIRVGCGRARRICRIRTRWSWSIRPASWCSRARRCRRS